MELVGERDWTRDSLRSYSSIPLPDPPLPPPPPPAVPRDLPPPPARLSKDWKKFPKSASSTDSLDCAKSASSNEA
eukprot:scaffold633_cov288-Ochromonas_danica.AAC.65